MKLREVAHTRTGDKGDTSNMSVIFFNGRDYEKFAPILDEKLVRDKVDSLFPESQGAKGLHVHRYELPNINALNFVIFGLLRGGVTRSLAIDAHGKTLSSILLDIEV
jgi:hypothetical protein